jgi:ATP-binding protein involved in chromosome partitioning
MVNEQVTEADILAALARVTEPVLERDLVSLNLIHGLRIDGGDVAFEVRLGTPAHPNKEEIAEASRAAVAALPGVKNIDVRITSEVPRSAGSQIIPGVRAVIAVGSGKGGVGKSTVAANLATALHLEGARVGLLDADIYGPSIPTMMGTAERPQVNERQKIEPILRHGVKVMSIALLMPDPSAPVMWRGPMIGRGVQQMLGDVDWGELDYLVVDLPPGTGDVQLTLAQVIPLTGAVIVMTAQDVAVNIATKALLFFQKLNVTVLGVVENMSTFACPHCGQVTPIFGKGGGEKRAAAMGAPFLGAVPLDPAIVEHGDQGTPTVVVAPDSAQARAFREISCAVAARVMVVQFADQRRGDEGGGGLITVTGGPQRK